MLAFILLGIGSFISWAAWVFVLFRFDPLVDGGLTHLMFYLSIGLALLGTLTIVGLMLHRARTGMIASREDVRRIGRQVMLATLFIIVLLYLAAHHWLTWWNIIPLALATLALELFFNSLHPKRSREYSKRTTFGQ